MLKDIYIKGFKTFVRPVRMPLERGITAIIGPNGSGKSNITDAVLFALGEQSPSLLRASSMSDVIFSGSETLKPAAVAEVTLVFDNSSGEISLPYEEVSITRRISRDGQNTYRINGAAARLTDVRAVAGEAGVGRHSVVRQGAVGAIVTGGPEASRSALEEAAGLGVYRRRRVSTAKRLERADFRLEESRRMEEEIASRLRRIEREAEAARRYRELEARYRSLSLAHLYRVMDSDLERRRADLGRVEERLHETSARERELQAQRERLSGRLEQLEGELERHDGVLQALEDSQERLVGLSVRLERASLRLDDIRRRNPEMATPRSVLEERARHLSATLVRARRRVEELEAEQKERAAAVERAEVELDAAHRKTRDLSRERSQAIVGVERLRAQLEHMAGDPARGTLPDGLLERLERLPQDLPGVVDAARIQERAASLRRRIHERRRRAEGLQTSACGREGSIAAVRAGLESTLRRLRAGRGSDGGPIRLREVIRARPGFESAVDAALRDLGEGVLAGDLGEGVRLVSEAEGVAVRLDASPVEEKGALPGVPLWECVEVIDRRYSEAIRRILCGIYVVESPSGVELSNGHVLVTPGGLRLTRASVARGGSGFFEREARIRREMEDLKRLESGPEAALESIQDELSRAAGALVRLSGASSKIDALAGRLLQVSDLLVSRARRRAASERRSQQREQKRRERSDAIAGEISRMQGHLEDVLGRLQTAEERASAASTALADAREALGSTGRRLAEGRRILHTLERYHRSLSQAIQGSVPTPSSSARELERDLRKTLQLCTRLSDISRERRESLRRSRDDASGERRRLSRLYGELSSEAASLAGELARARGERDRLAEDLRRAERATQAAEEELRSEWGATPEEARAQAEKFGPETEKERRKLASRLKNFGDVNLLAISQQEELRERHQFLASQREDAEEAAAELKRIILEIDREIERRFLGTFERVRGIFERIIPRMMPGGRGELGLSEDGVEIAVRIGKRGWKPLQVLSGGERSLLALAFLFSIFLGGARESGWFCMLDEAEAALDDLSLARFLSVVDSYRAKGQILLVTHQKRTMASADVLYGVSVDGTGATAVVSKRLKGE